MEFFGWEFSRKKDKEEEQASVIAKQNDDGAIQVSSEGIMSGVMVTGADFDSDIINESNLITKYREMSVHSEIDYAIDDIINEAMSTEEEIVVEINLDNVKLPTGTKKKVVESFDEVKSLLNFDNNAYEIFKKFYVDGRLKYHILIDDDKAKEGILELRYVDPRKIRKVREIEKIQENGVTLTRTKEEYYLYSPTGFMNLKRDTGIASDYEGVETVKITLDSIVEVNSGIMDKDNKFVLSYLHKILRPFNQLKILEDSAVIYRLVRAPERRIFYVDVGDLPKGKAEQYLRDMMIKHKNKMAYNPETGTVTNTKNNMSMLEDWWFPRREGGRSTEVDTLQGGSNLGEMDDIEYFLQKVYRALNIPYSRIDPQAGFNLGKVTEISRDEVKFSKFISRIRKRFSWIFTEILGVQLRLKGVMSQEDFDEFKNSIVYDYAVDNYFTELKNSEILMARLETLERLENYIGEDQYFSKEYARKEVLMQTDEEIKVIQQQIKDELASGEIEEPDEDEEEPQEKDNDKPSE